MAYGREELGEEVREGVEEDLRDYLEGRVDRFVSLRDLEEELLKEKQVWRLEATATTRF